MPSAPRDWAAPFLLQAREDLRAAWTIDRNSSPSTFCMLMQMVFEKLAKAGHARVGNTPKTHKVTSHLLNMLRRHPAARTIPQATSRVLQFIEELELAHPAIARLQSQPFPQLEYPWEDPNTGIVYHPARDLPLAKRVQDPKDRIAVDLLKLASALEKSLFHIFP